MQKESEIKVSSIYKGKHSKGDKFTQNHYLILEELNSGVFKVLKLNKSTAGVRQNKTLIAALPFNFKAGGCAFYSDELAIENIKHNSLLAEDPVEISAAEFDKILRDIVKFTAGIHYSCITAKKKSSYIPVSGKIDNKELSKMIDSSLDMWLTTGRFENEFRDKLTKFLNVKYSAIVNSGSSANLLAIAALTSEELKDRRLKSGDEIITIAAGFPTTIAPIIQNNLIPVFVDAKIPSYNIDESQIERAVTSKTKAIFAAHTLGNPFNIEAVTKIAEKYNLWVIEDNCDALGSKYNGKHTGTFGDISTFSFYPAHHITSGEGGAVCMRKADLYKIILSLRDWGRDCWCDTGKDNSCRRRFTQQFGHLPAGYDHKYVYSRLGYNLKMTDWQAAIGSAQADKLNNFIKKRKHNFNYLYSKLKKFENNLILPESEKHAEPCWFGFPITTRKNTDKFGLVKFLEDNGIGTRQLFAGNILKQPVFTQNHFKLRILDSKFLYSNKLNSGDYSKLPNTDRIMTSTFWLGVFPGLTDGNFDYIADKFREYFNKV